MVCLFCCPCRLSKYQRTLNSNLRQRLAFSLRGIRLPDGRRASAAQSSSVTSFRRLRTRCLLNRLHCATLNGGESQLKKSKLTPIFLKSDLPRNTNAFFGKTFFRHYIRHRTSKYETRRQTGGRREIACRIKEHGSGSFRSTHAKKKGGGVPITAPQ